MSIPDPKNYAVVKKTAVKDDDTDDLRDQIATLNAQVQALLASKSGLDDAKLETILLRVAQVSAEAQERAINPSNKTHPGISVYSYPEGDRAKPRAFKCPMFWVGYDMELDTTTAEEVELLNRATPGVYRFLRTDGSQETLTITGEQAPDGTWQRLLFDFPVKERRETLPGMAQILRSALGIKTKEQEELDRLRAEVEALRAVTVG